MEEEAACSHHEVSQQSNTEDLIMSISTTAENALNTEPHKHQVRQGVHDLGRIWGGIVVLRMC